MKTTLLLSILNHCHCSSYFIYPVEECKKNCCCFKPEERDLGLTEDLKLKKLTSWMSYWQEYLWRTFGEHTRWWPSR